ncbi:MAG: hypothetical protein MUF49_31485 [Oculatellaceae cyanobacterium Prado106]|jgi:hypothetical protein|nr:hypothetical protein [Oculatellaceae cyanobacterium Prado106]
MADYQEVLSLAQRLTLNEQIQLVETLTAVLEQVVSVEGTDEIIPADEIAESEAALKSYWEGQDPGLSSAELKQRLFGGNFG